LASIETTIANYGFPIAVAIWLLYERVTTMKQFTNAITKLTALIEAKL